jgi:hypothetical protein
MKDENKNIDSITYQLYLNDLGFLLRDYALEAKENRNLHKTDYYTGYLMGFHRVISLMQQQAEGFQIPLREINLHDIDPEKDLI